jgi:hypothetical protein
VIDLLGDASHPIFGVAVNMDALFFGFRSGPKQCRVRCPNLNTTAEIRLLNIKAFRGRLD